MRCIICDKCGAILSDAQQLRIVSCQRPIQRPAMPGGGKREIDGHPPRDVIWSRELCVSCAMEVEAGINNTPSEAPGSGGTAGEEEGGEAL